MKPSGLVAAVAFLTRVPVGGASAGVSDPARAAPWFPAAGLGIGAVVACIYAALHAIVPPLVAAGLALGAGMLVTGALHEDGLGDVADGFGGAREREDVLRIMDDPRQGTFGVLALGLSIFVRASALAALGSWAAAAALPAAHALSRSAAVGVMLFVPPAGAGLGAAYGRGLNRRHAAWGAVAGAVVGMGLLGWWGLAGAVAGAVAAAGLGRAARRRIGGVNGDVLGAVQQLAETAVLVAAAGAVQSGMDRPWWLP